MGLTRLQPGTCCGCGPVHLCVTACGIPLYGAIVAVSGVGSCTTAAGGCCDIAGLAAGTYTVTVTFDGTTIFSGSRTLIVGTNIIAIATPSNVVCCGGAYIPKTLTLTDAIGTLTLGYYGFTGPTTQAWYACRMVTVTSCVENTTGGGCVVAAPASGPVMVCYQMTCDSSASPPFQLERSWKYTTYTGGGTFAPYPLSGGSCPAPGAACLLPDSCVGFPHTNTADGTAAPTSTSPFTVSFTMTDNGANLTPDPVGGNCVASQ